MAKKTVRLNAKERAICRVRYKEVSKTMVAGSSRSTNEICKAIAAHYKDGGDLETGSEYSALLFPFGNQKAVNRHIQEAHVDSADRAIAEKWVKEQPVANQSQVRTLLGLDDTIASEGEEHDVSESDPESDAPPVPASKRKASKASPGKAKPAAKRRRKDSDKDSAVKTEEDSAIKGEDVIKTEE